GECSLCRVKLISGKVYQPEGVKLRQADRRFGYIHSCAAFPITDCEIML
ncbi:MAG TPA: 2Fe-2S iron-sulfur cluster binding domain-containing protein, partial [Spirochaetota bacterium]|nr:2Fe-2S iron-sulfur cluster binding domain-containing protein [Spirochaetota bacterium]HQG43317.1 2Fe-2S iron-sulfur cluster binding domain-containing protein [Spirochaetota bacterium]